MATVLWGKRQGDLQYNSREYWRQTIPIRPDVILLTILDPQYFDVGMLVETGGTETPYRLVGMAGTGLGLIPEN